MLYLLLYTCVAVGVLISGGLFIFLTRKRRERRSPSRPLGQLALALVVAFVIAELCVRLAMTAVFGKDTQPTAFDAELGWSRPPANRVAPDANAESKEPFIVFVGDSVAFGHGVAPEQGMVQQTRLRLGSRGGSVLNAAVSGYGLDQESLYVKRHLPGWENLETLVWVVFAGNDLADTASNMRYGHNKPLFRHGGDGLRQSSAGLSRYSCRNLMTDSRLIFSFEALHPRFSQLVDGLCGRVTLGEEETRAVVQAVVADLLHETSQRGIVTVLVLVPAKEDFLAPSPSFLWLEESLQKSGSPLLSLLRLLPSRGVDANSLYLPGDPWHLSVEGHQVVGDLIAESIRGRSPPG